MLRNALQGLAEDIQAAVGPMGYRVFVDSGPVLEKALANKAGIGWIGKHTNLIARDAGSYFFIGEILTDLPLDGYRTERAVPYFTRLGGFSTRYVLAQSRGDMPPLPATPVFPPTEGLMPGP